MYNTEITTKTRRGPGPDAKNTKTDHETKNEPGARAPPATDHEPMPQRYEKTHDRLPRTKPWAASRAKNNDKPKRCHQARAYDRGAGANPTRGTPADERVTSYDLEPLQLLCLGLPLKP